MDMFNFTTAASASAVASYAPAGGSNSNSNSNSGGNSGGLGDMNFSQMPQYSGRNPLQSMLSQTKEGPDAKRIKVESPHSALDSIDSWLQFDEDADKFGSFEIDFSKQYNTANQPR
jgi:type IV secretory pathway TrbL component